MFTFTQHNQSLIYYTVTSWFFFFSVADYLASVVTFVFFFFSRYDSKTEIEGNPIGGQKWGIIVVVFFLISDKLVL